MFDTLMGMFGDPAFWMMVVAVMVGYIFVKAIPHVIIGVTYVIAVVVVIIGAIIGFFIGIVQGIKQAIKDSKK